MKFPFQQVQSRLHEFKERKYFFSRMTTLDTLRIAPEPIENPLDFSEKNGKWRAFHVGDAWPRIDAYYWLHIPLQVPDHLPEGHLAFWIELSDEYTLHTPEGFVFVNGATRQGIDRMHPYVCLSKGERDPRYDIAIRVYTGAAMNDIRPAAVRPASLESCSIAVTDLPARDFYYLAQSLFGALATMPDDSRTRHQLLTCLVEAFHQIDYRYPRSEEFYGSIGKALRFLKSAVKDIPVSPLPETVTGVGHAHIDVAWLWPLQRTREKAVHTFSTVLDLMQGYPEFHFFQSQAQLYEFVQQDQPEIFNAIKERIRKGQWEADGGMWVEADCNLPSGESLVRQFLYGCRYFEEELGVKPKVLWLPDVFGYSWAIPQILKQAEIEYFVTSKISWNQYNAMPFDTFRWRGMDGSEVMSYFITVPGSNLHYTYNGLLEPREIKGTWENFKPKSLHHEVLLPFGYGDGGGGPTEEMLLTARGLRDVPGFPTTRLGRVDDFLRRLNWVRDQAPVWNGELYLEYHRGTYTSQAQQKKRNREAEFAMQQTEFLLSLAALTGLKYPHARLRKVWERILLNQFHDILPGSSIHAVYEESERDYDWITEEAEAMIDEASASLFVNPPENNRDKTYTVLNPLSWPRSEPFIAEDVETESLYRDMHGQILETQTVLTIDDEAKVLMRWPLPPYSANSIYLGESTEDSEPDNSLEEDTIPRPASVTSIKPSKTLSQKSPLRCTERLLENEILKVKFNANGELASVFDKEIGREVVAEGATGNVFQAFEDKPLQWDAWDIEMYYQDKLLTTGSKADFDIMQRGPLCATLRIQKAVLDGIVEQYISIYRGSRQIEFDTRIEWVNKDTLLKVAFPVAVHSTMATYDIQFGNVQRPTHWNTSWDWARFETCAQKWVDLSEGDYGVSLLNNGKYGHDIHDNVMRITLIKCASAPDPLADVGEHRFAYCLYPHPGDWRAARIPQKAYEFNVNPVVREGLWNHPTLSGGTPLVSVDRDHVIVETIKIAEKDDSLLIRLYECYNQRGRIQLTFPADLRSASECNLLERQDRPLPVKGNTLTVPIRPYEIKTLKVNF